MFVKQSEVNVREAVLMDLKRIHEAVRSETAQLHVKGAPSHEIGRKLLFLFQCDLLPGISGKILDLKGSRDSATVKHVSLRSKITAWAFLFLLDTGMMFYILLFALTQTGPRQNAWFQSFALWLVVEILLVSTGIVFVTHILIPSLVMKDLNQIKRRLMDNIRDFNDRVQDSVDASKGGEATTKGAEGRGVLFNAANFLFVSTRLAKQFPDLKESKIIMHFSTPWPRQSYLRVQNVSKKYSKKFSALTRSASILLIFFVGNFLSVPPTVQDMVVQMTTTTAVGYVVLIHVQLYGIFPALVVLPALLVLALAHFIIQSGKSDAQLRLARLFPKLRRKGKSEPAVDSVIATEGSSPVALAVPESDDDDEEYKMSDESDSDASTPGDMAVAVRVANAHKTRRQSIGAGLNVIRALQERVQRGEAVYEPSEYSDLSLSSEDTGDSHSADQLHRPAGLQSSFHRVLSRGVTLVTAKSRASDYSVEVPVPGDEDPYASDGSDASGTGSDLEDDAESATSSDDDCSSSSASDTSESDGDAHEEEEGEGLGELVRVGRPDRAYSCYSQSLSTISNRVPAHLAIAEDVSHVTTSSYYDSDSVSAAKGRVMQADVAQPVTLEGVAAVSVPPGSLIVQPFSAGGGSSAHGDGHSSASGDDSSVALSSSGYDTVSDLSADADAERVRRGHVYQQDLAPIQVVYDPAPDAVRGKIAVPAVMRGLSGSSVPHSRKSSAAQVAQQDEECSYSSESEDTDCGSEESSDGVGLAVQYCALTEHTGGTPLSQTPPRSADVSTGTRSTAVAGERLQVPTEAESADEESDASESSRSASGDEETDADNSNEEDSGGSEI
jgi:hypothetical protein